MFTAPPTPGRARSAFPRRARLAHRYLIAPALLFFALTGALQTFSLHETTRGSSYRPPAWIMVLAQIHKKQTPIVPQKKKAAAAEPPQAAPVPAQAPTPRHNPLPLKIFFLLVAVGLFASTASGIYMSYKHTRSKALVTVLLAAGTLIPVGLILI